jgi:hypothetical protein
MNRRNRLIPVYAVIGLLSVLVAANAVTCWAITQKACPNPVNYQGLICWLTDENEVITMATSASSGLTSWEGDGIKRCHYTCENGSTVALYEGTFPTGSQCP